MTLAHYWTLSRWRGPEGGQLARKRGAVRPLRRGGCYGSSDCGGA
jgi:hypothetical protein